jgi:hypothetical protein
LGIIFHDLSVLKSGTDLAPELRDTPGPFLAAGLFLYNVVKHYQAALSDERRKSVEVLFDALVAMVAVDEKYVDRAAR